MTAVAFPHPQGSDHAPDQAVISAAILMYQRGLVTGTLGNVSVRVGDDMLITPTRRYYDDLVPSDLVSVPTDGYGTRRDPRASREAGMHAAIYTVRSDVHAIAHSHSPYALARSFDPSPLRFMTEERVYLGLDQLDVVPETRAGSPELARLVAEHLRDRPACLLARHGVVAVAKTPRDAVELCSAVEHQAQIQWLLSIPGGNMLSGYASGQDRERRSR